MLKPNIARDSWRLSLDIAVLCRPSATKSTDFGIEKMWVQYCWLTKSSCSLDDNDIQLTFYSLNGDSGIMWHAYSRVEFCEAAVYPAFALTHLYKCSFDWCDMFDINIIYMHDNNSTATLNWITNCWSQAIVVNKLLVIYLPADGYFCIGWCRETRSSVSGHPQPSQRTIPGTFGSFFLSDGTEPMKILFVCVRSVLILIDCWDESFDW